MAERRKFTITAFREKTGRKAPQALLNLRREQLEIGSKIMKALASGPRTVPEIAEQSGLLPRTVLWYLMTCLKYDLVSVSSKTEDGYYRYAIREKRKKGE